MDEVDAFYTTRQWRSCRAAYLKRVRGLCERCLRKGLLVPATQVHHRTRLTPDNLRDPAVALNWANLEALCEQCHQQEHRPRRWRCGPDGRVRF